jgi:hypothetical protein
VWIPWKELLEQRYCPLSFPQDWLHLPSNLLQEFQSFFPAISLLQLLHFVYFVPVQTRHCQEPSTRDTL